MYFSDHNPPHFHAYYAGEDAYYAGKDALIHIQTLAVIAGKLPYCTKLPRCLDPVYLCHRKGDLRTQTRC